MKLLWRCSRGLHTSSRVASEHSFKRVQLGNQGLPGPRSSYQERKQEIRDPDRHTRLTIDSSKKEWAELVNDGKAPAFVKIHTSQKTELPRQFPLLFLRDSCRCPQCVDPNSTQKNFSTTQIPDNIKLKTLNCRDTGLDITWENDVPGFEDHVTHIPRKLIQKHLVSANTRASLYNWQPHILWGKKDAESLEQVNYEVYLNDDKALFTALIQLRDYGILFLRGVPEDEKSVEHVAQRIGNLRDTLYGRTWDVKSIPKARNIAYTKQYLGFHMDLLYTANPPGFQLLHCLKNSASGGSAIFSDSFKAFGSLSKGNMQHLAKLKLGYHYDNDGYHYARTASVAEKLSVADPISAANLRAINFSPQFQSPLLSAPSRPDLQEDFHKKMRAFKAFVHATEAEEGLYEYRYKPGDCVIFNNRRVLHGRREFDPEAGERWLKGCYIDTDVFTSKLRVLHEKYRPWYAEEAKDE